MKKLLIVVSLSLVAGEALAINRYDTPGMSCAEVQAVVERDGAAILRYRSARNPSLTLYGRYVRNRQYCEPEEMAQSSTVPAADTKACRVKECIQAEIFENRRD